MGGGGQEQMPLWFFLEFDFIMFYIILAEMLYLVLTSHTLNLISRDFKNPLIYDFHFYTKL